MSLMRHIQAVRRGGVADICSCLCWWKAGSNTLFMLHNAAICILRGCCFT